LKLKLGRQEVLWGLGFLLFGVFLLVTSSTLPHRGQDLPLRSGFFPSLLGGLLIILSLLQILHGWKEDVPFKANFYNTSIVPLLFIVTLSSLLVIHIAGFIVGAVALVFFVQYVLGVRPILKITLNTFTIVLTVYLIFIVFMRVGMPAGIIFS